MVFPVRPNNLEILWSYFIDCECIYSLGNKFFGLLFRHSLSFISALPETECHEGWYSAGQCIDVHEVGEETAFNWVGDRADVVLFEVSGEDTIESDKDFTDISESNVINSLLLPQGELRVELNKLFLKDTNRCIYDDILSFKRLPIITDHSAFFILLIIANFHNPMLSVHLHLVLIY